MFKRTQSFQIGKALADKILAALVNAAPAAILDVTAKVHLYKAGPAPAYVSLATDFTESDFAGYAAIVLASVIGPINIPGGEGMHKELDWLQAAGASTDQHALGYYVTDTTGAIYYGGEVFDSPVPFGVAGDGLSLDLILAPKSLWGGENQA